MSTGMKDGRKIWEAPKMFNGLVERVGGRGVIVEISMSAGPNTVGSIYRAHGHDLDCNLVTSQYSGPSPAKALEWLLANVPLKWIGAPAEQA